MESLESLAYEAALRSLDKQEQVLTELRSRTGLLLAASSLAVSFLGRPTDPKPIFVVTAFAAFAVSLVASLYILLPRQDLLFTLVGANLYEQMYEFRGDLAEVHRRLAYDLDRFWEANDRKLQPLFRAFRIAVSLWRSRSDSSWRPRRIPCTDHADDAEAREPAASAAADPRDRAPGDPRTRWWSEDDRRRPFRPLTDARIDRDFERVPSRAY